MSTVFTKIIQGDLPANFVWKDEYCVAFADIEPQTIGHVLVVPRQEISKFSDLDETIAAHLMVVAKRIAKAQEVAFQATRAMLYIEGYAVPHVHLHVFPTKCSADGKPANKIAKPDDITLQTSMHTLRQEIIAQGWQNYVPN